MMKEMHPHLKGDHSMAIFLTVCYSSNFDGIRIHFLELIEPQFRANKQALGFFMGFPLILQRNAGLNKCYTHLFDLCHLQFDHFNKYKFTSKCIHLAMKLSANAEKVALVRVSTALSQEIIVLGLLCPSRTMYCLSGVIVTFSLYIHIHTNIH